MLIVSLFFLFSVVFDMIVDVVLLGREIINIGRSFEGKFFVIFFVQLRFGVGECYYVWRFGVVQGFVGRVDERGGVFGWVGVFDCCFVIDQRVFGM